MHDIKIGDLMQIWIDVPGYLGRVGRVVRIGDNRVVLRIGGVQTQHLTLNLETKTAKVPMLGRSYSFTCRVEKTSPLREYRARSGRVRRK